MAGSTAAVASLLPPGVSVWERGWLSSNNIFMDGARGTALVDSGYHTHAPQTRALLASALRGRGLDLLLNTHLHSDHCGGNAALQAQYPALQTHIPPGQASQVQAWDSQALGYGPTGQECPRFQHDACLRPSSSMLLGDRLWEVHAAPGHDPHSVMLWEPHSRTLLSADALWERGFGVVFPELDGAHAFDEVAATLDLIERLRPAIVIPGHGAVFTDVAAALACARQRLHGFVRSPAKHQRYAAKVLVKFKLLQAQRIERAALEAWAQGAAYVMRVLAQCAPDQPLAMALNEVLQDLVRAGAARVQGTWVLNDDTPVRPDASPAKA